MHRKGTGKGKGMGKGKPTEKGKGKRKGNGNGNGIVKLSPGGDGISRASALQSQEAMNDADLETDG